MDGTSVQKYWSNEMQAMLDTYKQFEVLLPAKKRNGAAHNGEDGRYVETLIREYLKKYLPKDLEVLTGFILRPAVKTGLKSKVREREEEDSHSTQLDILVYNTGQYPVFHRFGENVIVPPEGVVGIISVKKRLKENDIVHEAQALREASKLCRCIDDHEKAIRGPFLALVSMNAFEKKEKTTAQWIFEKLEEVYSDENYFDDLIGYIGSFNEWSIFKKRPRNRKVGEYIFFEHNEEELHMGFQFLLTGILSVFYDSTRHYISRPGFTAFPSRRSCDRKLGEIKVKAIRYESHKGCRPSGK